ncbi:pitrilysin family protein [Rurimicrobium arvi]|uniref:Insulinase family protein n=1 Tax=Rurimicrobium arvi TaxID=2049916 RepID=A0ABP8MGI3_9BACT
MKKITCSILALSLAIVAGAQTLDRSQRPKPGPAPEIKLGKTETFTLPNGLKVFVVENHKLPTVSFSIQLDIRQELQGSMTGYSDFVGELLTSGTKTRSKEKLNEDIDYIGASISANAEGVFAFGLKKNMNKILELMSDVTLNSDFQQKELDKLKTQALSGLETSKNDPDAMMANVSKVLNYTTNHPYGEVETEATINAITLERCKSYYQTYFRPNVAYMAVVGDITAAEVKPLLTKYFGAWEKKDVPVAVYSPVEAPLSPKVAFVPREGAVQSVISITSPIELKPGGQDEFAAKVANTVLGGGSQGRLFLNLREKHAWTYGSYSSLNTDILVGNFEAEAKARNPVTDSSIAEIIAEMNRLKTESVDKESLQNTINYIGGNFAISLESPQRIAQMAINIQRYKLPADYYQNYLKNLSAVTASDVQTAAQKYMDPAHMNIIIVGSKDEVAAKVARFAKNNKITYYDNYGNIIVPSETKSAGNVKAEDVLKKYADAIGGEKAINNLKDIKMIRKGSMQGSEITIATYMKGNNKLKNVVTANANGQIFTIQRMVLNGDKGTKEGGGQGASAMNAEEIAEAKEQADMQAELHPAQYGSTYAVKGIVKLNDKDAYWVEETNKKGEKSSSYYEVETGYLVKKAEAGDADGPGQIIEFGNYKEVPGTGYKVPYTMKLMGGEFTIQTVEVNKGIPDKEFE